MLPSLQWLNFHSPNQIHLVVSLTYWGVTASKPSVDVGEGKKGELWFWFPTRLFPLSLLNRNMNLLPKSRTTWRVSRGFTTAPMKAFLHTSVTVNRQNKLGVGFLRQITVIRLLFLVRQEKMTFGELWKQGCIVWKYLMSLLFISFHICYFGTSQEAGNWIVMAVMLMGNTSFFKKKSPCKHAHIDNANIHTYIHKCINTRHSYHVQLLSVGCWHTTFAD